MDITITHVSQGQFGRNVSFSANGISYEANLMNNGRQSLYAFGQPGDDCVTTHEIDAPEILAAVVALVSA